MQTATKLSETKMLKAFFADTPKPAPLKGPIEVYGPHVTVTGQRKAFNKLAAQFEHREVRTRKKYLRLQQHRHVQAQKAQLAYLRDQAAYYRKAAAQCGKAQLMMAQLPKQGRQRKAASGAALAHVAAWRAATRPAKAQQPGSGATVTTVENKAKATALQAQGATLGAMAAALGMCRRSVRKLLSMEA